MAEKYLKPGDVTAAQAKRVLDFLNSVRTAQEIAATVEFSNERDVGTGVGQNILDRRAELGKFTHIRQVNDVYHVGPERFTEIIEALGILQDVSGTYRSPTPSGWGPVLELRVDVDGRRPMNRVSADMFYRLSFWSHSTTMYLASFVIETVTATESNDVMTLKGGIKYYSDPGNTAYSIEVTIPRVTVRSGATATATVKIYHSGVLENTFVCGKISSYLRTVKLEIDRFQGTIFPSGANTALTPHPADLAAETITCAEVYRRAGIGMTVVEDDVLNDADSDDPGSNWDEGELHDLMEDHFSDFANTLQWNCYGVIVPRFGDPNYNAGYYGVMFDWGGWQAGDSYLRQGGAIAWDALMGRSSGTLYDTAAKRDRFFLETFVHEIGHAFNLPHTWSRSANPDSGSESFMNYPWKYTGGTGGETAFWSNFRWEFDDVELIWMRHGDRKNVIFGGQDWIGNNLSIYTEPEMEQEEADVRLEVRSGNVFDFGQLVRVELKLKNVSEKVQTVNARLQPEDDLVAIYITKPNREIVRYVPPVRRDCAPEYAELAPGESLYESVLLSYSAKGALFQEPGEYVIRAYYGSPDTGMAVSPRHRIRIAAPYSRNTEELAHLVFGYDSAKFLYYSGTESSPDAISNLKEAVSKYAGSDAAAVRDIAAALGMHASRPFKKVSVKNGKRVVIKRETDLPEAATYLENARRMLPATGLSSLDNITYNRISARLADCYLEQDNAAQAEQSLKETLHYLEARNVIAPVITDYRNRIRHIPKKQS